MTTPVPSPYLDAFAAARDMLPGARHPRVTALRERAIAEFARNGFPTQKVEDWKFTSLNALTKALYGAPADPPPAIDRTALAPHRLAGAQMLVFVNGRFAPDLSDAEAAGVTCGSLADLMEWEPEALGGHLLHGASGRGHGLVALNAAFAADGAAIRIGPAASPERPIQLLFLTVPGAQPAAIHSRNLVVLDEGAKAKIFERHAGLAGGSYWSNAVTHLRLAQGAALHHYKLQAEAAGAFHTSLTEAALGADSAYASFVMSTGAALSRNEIEARFEGEGVTCTLNGVSLARGRQHMDHTTRIDHARPRGTSSEAYKAVIDDQAHVVFQGRIRVAPDAQKTDARQLNRSLMLSDGAQADAKPELEILADDVKCSHGATVGDLDKDALFYLRARGIDETSARGLLVEAFVGELIDGIEDADIGNEFRRAFHEWLGRTGVQQ